MCKRFICFISILVLSLTCTSYADVVIGDFEDGMEGWSGNNGATIDIGETGATTGSKSLVISNLPTSGFIWAAYWEGLVDMTNCHTLSVDITWIASEWDPQSGIWVNFKDMAINSDGPSGWWQDIPIDPINPDWPGSWDPANWGDQTRTLTYDLSNYDATGATWMQVHFSSNMGSVTTAGNFYVDNVVLVGAEPIAPAEPKIVYVDATDGEGGNTTLATGEVLIADDPGTVGSGSDDLWRGRVFANEGTIFESAGDWSGANPEDCPRLVTNVDVPEGSYDVYAYMWTADSATWRIAASLEDSEGDLPLYLCNDPNGAATLAVAEDFEEPVPLLAEDNRTLWQVHLGTTDTTTMITVYIDDDAERGAAGDGGNARTWYDGIGYKIASEPEPDTGLIAAYSFEGDTLDASGNAFDGVIIGDPVFVEGAVGQALDFNGDDYVDCGADEAFSVTESLTVALWVNIRTIPTAWTGAITKGNTAWRISNNGTSTGMHFGFENGSRGWQAANSATELNTGEWYHVCGIYDINVGAKIYIDGVEDGSNPDTEGITQNTSIVAIGTNSDSTYPEQAWDGQLDEVMIYDRPLSADEVLALAGN